MRNRASLGCSEVDVDVEVSVTALGEGGTGDKPQSRRVARLLISTSSGRSLDDRVYMDGTCRLNASITWPLLETGFALSRYAVKLSSRQRISGCVELTEVGELDDGWAAVDTMLHIGQPSLGGKAILTIS